MAARPLVAFDTECYRDYFLALFKELETGRIFGFERTPAKELDVDAVRRVLNRFTIITFNGRNYDIPVLSLALTGASNAMLKAASDKIILEKFKPWDFEKYFGTQEPACDHIDLFEVSPGKASLKLYGGRMHSRKLQDLPIDPSASIPEKHYGTLRAYCANDLQLTIDLFTTLRPQIELRAKMSRIEGIDLRSKSDAQIAEAVIRKDVEKILKRKIEKSDGLAGMRFKYKIPDFIRFETPELRAVLDEISGNEFLVGEGGSVELPPWLSDKKIAMGRSVYRMGIGGLHSSEERQAIVADGLFSIVDRDVTSYYPNIILNQKLYPEQMGPPFLVVYGGKVKDRIEHKRKGMTVEADCEKILVNGSFGKLGNRYSALYSPTLLIQTTITGQLSLLMLIERLERAGIEVVSANTDGVVMLIKSGKEADAELAVMCWEAATGFETEETRYLGIYSRDVNNYIAVKEKGGVKLKGAYKTSDLSKNPTQDICTEAVVAFLSDGGSIEDTIRNCKDVRKFLCVRTVNGGAQKDGRYLGKAIRWYYAKGETGTINYAANGNKVPNSLGARPLMLLPDAVPDDLDYDHYIEDACCILQDIGVLPPDPPPERKRRVKHA